MSTSIGTGRIGDPVPRIEDNRLTTGRTRYVGDITPPGTLHLRFVRSPHAHARITDIRPGEFEELPEDAIIFTGKDFPDIGIQADVRQVPPVVEPHERSDDNAPTELDPRWQTSLQPSLANGKVRYVGEPVAAVLHPDAYVAEDAVDAVSVHYEELPAVVDLGQALEDDAPLLHEDWRDNVFIARRREHGKRPTTKKKLRSVRVVTRNHRQAGVSLEGRGCVAEPSADGLSVTLWTSTQMPHLVQTYVSRMLNIPENRLRVVAPEVGGGFGVKGHVFPEEVLVTALALRVGRPVKWIEDRVEHLLSSIHARDHVHRLEAIVDNTGRVHELKGQFIVDAGAYSVFPWTAGSDSGMVPKVIVGPYDLPSLVFEDIAVATNKCPIGTYRGVGRPSAVFSIERLMDTIAAELDLCPTKVREVNLVKDFPHTTAHGLVYDAGTYVETLHKVKELLDWDARHKAPKEEGRYRRGIGLAVFNEQTAHGTPDFEVRGTPIETGYQGIRVEISPDGTVKMFGGFQSHGQSLETTLAQVAASELGVPYSSVRLFHGDTFNSPYSVGTWGSRVAVLGGGAVARACRRLREKITKIAAFRLGVDEDQVVIDQGVVSAKGVDTTLTFAQIAEMATRRAAKLPPGVTQGLDVVEFVDGPDRGTFSNACHGAEVSVDTWTGKVSIERYVVAEDCGTVLNPVVVDGQVQGGIAQGIGTALLEEFEYSDTGQPMSSTFMDYLLPTASDIPAAEMHHFATPSPWTENGVKGVGESGAIVPPAAVASAVSNALGAPVYETPMTMERLTPFLAQADQPHEPYLSWEFWDEVESLAGFWAQEEKEK